MMRGRDAIAVALRHPDGRIVWASERLDTGFHKSPASRAPFVRGLVILYETLVVGTRWLIRAAGLQVEDEGVEIGRGSVAIMLLVTAVLAVGLFFLLPLVVATFTVGDDHGDLMKYAVEGLVRVGLFLGYLALVARTPDIAPRVPVPRRRAHDDPRARGRRPAPPRGHPQVPDGPPALRHGVPGGGDPAVHHRLRARRQADAARHGRQPDPADPGDRVRGLRAAPPRRPPPLEPRRAGDHVARDPGPDDHDQAAHRRHDRGRDRRRRGGAPRRRRADPGRRPRPRPRPDAAARRARRPDARGGRCCRRDRRRRRLPARLAAAAEDLAAGPLDPPAD